MKEKRNAREFISRILVRCCLLDSQFEMKKIKKFLGIEGEVVSCVSEIVLLFLNVSETQPASRNKEGLADPKKIKIQIVGSARRVLHLDA